MRLAVLIAVLVGLLAAPALASSGDAASADRDHALAVSIANYNRQQQATHATTAKSCSSGWKRARINGSIKCLRVGQFCAHAYDRSAPHPYSYKHYGYACRKRDSRGNYHLTYRY